MKKVDKDITLRSGPFKIYLSENRKYRHLSVGIEGEGKKLKFELALPYLFFVTVRIMLPFKIAPHEGRQLRLYYHSRAFWLSLWTEPLNGRYHSFHWDDFFFGKSTCHRELIETKALTIPMPEKSYEAHAKLVLYRWTRPRWFTKEMVRCEIEVPEGIPHEGKGENSWDCGVDATFGITTGAVRDIHEGVGILVSSCLRDRVRYGGWSDYHWSKKATV